MNKTLKWVLISLGILVGLALIAVVVMHLIAAGGMRGYMMENYQRLPYGNGQDGNFDGVTPHMRGFSRMPMMGWMHMGAFGFFRGFFGLGVLALAVTAVVLLIRGDKARSAAKAAAPAVTPPVVQRTCKHCGKLLEAEWVACPHCGKKQ